MKIINIKDRRVIQISETKQIPVNIVLGVVALLASLILFYILLTGKDPITKLYEIVNTSSKWNYKNSLKNEEKVCFILLFLQ